MLFEIINPSDPYFMESDSFEAACVACLHISHQMCLKEYEGEHDFPIPMFWKEADLDAYWQETFGHDFPREMPDELRGQVVAALKSVTIGSPQDFYFYKKAMAAITDEAARAQFAHEWDDRKRSSINQIGRRAHSVAKALETPLTTPAER
jgi:hypothetical protein